MIGWSVTCDIDSLVISAKKLAIKLHVNAMQSKKVQQVVRPNLEKEGANKLDKKKGMQG
jgi:hypothetical protein